MNWRASDQAGCHDEREKFERCCTVIYISSSTWPSKNDQQDDDNDDYHDDYDGEDDDDSADQIDLQKSIVSECLASS